MFVKIIQQQKYSKLLQNKNTKRIQKIFHKIFGMFQIYQATGLFMKCLDLPYITPSTPTRPLNSRFPFLPVKLNIIESCAVKFLFDTLLIQSSRLFPPMRAK